MPTIVVHGTMTHEPAHAYDWWWKSYDGQGFLAGLTQGIGEAGGLDDIWKVGGTDVSRHPELQGGRRSFSTRDGRFLWSGGNQGGLRRVAGEQLARYLNVVAQLSPRAPIRVIAHSHGCNVVKRASASTRLSPQVFIPQAVFLACPHVVSSSSFGSKYPYRLNPERFGRILGLSSPRDSVQNVLAARFPSLWGGDFLEGWAPHISAVDQDPAARHLYEDHDIPTHDIDKAAHSALHGNVVGYLVGRWLSGEDFASIERRFSHLLPVPEGDFGS